MSRVKDSLRDFEKKYPHTNRLGYSKEEVDAVIGERREEFDDWMRGQTVAVGDDGGALVYIYDLWRFVSNNAHKDWWD